MQDVTYIFFHIVFTFAKKSINFKLFRYNFLFSFSSLYNKTFENIISKKIDELIDRKNIYFRKILKNNLANIKHNKKIKRRQQRINEKNRNIKYFYFKKNQYKSFHNETNYSFVF